MSDVVGAVRVVPKVVAVLNWKWKEIFLGIFVVQQPKWVFLWRKAKENISQLGRWGSCTPCRSYNSARWKLLIDCIKIKSVVSKKYKLTGSHWARCLPSQTTERWKFVAVFCSFRMKGKLLDSLGIGPIPILLVLQVSMKTWHLHEATTSFRWRGHHDDPGI